MTGAGLFISLRAMLLRWAKLAPPLFRHDPLFRYAAIAAVLALIFLAVSMVQDDSRYGGVTGTDDAIGSKATTPDRVGQRTTSRTESAGTGTPPAPGSAAQPEDTPAIAPGRSLDGIDVEPAPRDDFGTLPQRGGKP